MRILIDLQGCQTGSRHRGIGRYAKALAEALLRNKRGHEFFILLNGLFVSDAESLKLDFASYIPVRNIITFLTPSLTEGLITQNDWRKRAAELLREEIINKINPDILLLTSLFEGALDDGITSIGLLESNVKTAVILYDLIPLSDPPKYLLDQKSRLWYESKLDSLRRADMLLSISDSARGEAINLLGYDGDRVKTIYSAADERFTSNIVRDQKGFLLRFGITRKFVMHASAFEPRKNFDGLIRAFGRLPPRLRDSHQLVLVSAIASEGQIELRRLADAAGLGPDALVFAGYLSDADLVSLYSLCTLFVFPSLHEGFGLPALEAMCCGALVIGSNTTSVPEVIGWGEALFDPHSDESIAAVMRKALSDKEFRELLKIHVGQQSKLFSWDRSAKLALDAFEEMALQPAKPCARSTILATSGLVSRIARIHAAVWPTKSDLIAVAEAISKNESVVSQWKDVVVIDTAAPEECEPTGSAQASFARSSANLLEISGRWPDVERISHRPWCEGEQIRILLLKLDQIGDFIITLGAFDLIRKTWPKAHLTLVCGPWNKALAEKSGLFDRVVACSFLPQAGADYDKYDLEKYGVGRYRSLGLAAYDLAVDMRYYGDTRILLAHTDARNRAGYASEGIDLELALPEVPETAMRAHVGARAMALAAAVTSSFGAGGTKVAQRCLLNGAAPMRFFREKVVVGIAIGTGNPIKSWGRERFAELIRLLWHEGGRQFIFLGSTEDRSDTEFISRSLPKESFIDLSGSLSLADLPPVVAGLDLFIGNDTGTTHMAATLGIPTICLFSGQSHVHSWRPVGEAVTTLRKIVSCSPCYLVKVAECPNNHKCMDISPAYVAEEAALLLKCLRPSTDAAHRVPSAVAA